MRTYKIVDVRFDTDGDNKLAKALRDRYIGTNVSVEVDDMDEEEALDVAMDAVSDHSGWCIFSIQFEKVEA